MRALRCDRGAWYAPCSSALAATKTPRANRLGRARQEATTMERIRSTVQGGGVQAALAKLALSFGMVLWMFVVATLSHV